MTINWGDSAWNKLLSVVLVIAILGALGMLGYMAATPRGEEEFTEFYILGLEGEAADYPKELNPEETGVVLVGIINHEQETKGYRVEVISAGKLIGQLESVTLQDEQEFENKLYFSPVVTGVKMKVEFLLFKEGESEPYRSLHLWIDVKG